MGKCQLLFFRFVNYCRSDKRCLLGNLCFKFFRARAITIFTNPRFTIVSPLCNRVFDEGSLKLTKLTKITKESILFSRDDARKSVRIYY